MKKMLALLSLAACATVLSLSSMPEASAAPKFGRAKPTRTFRVAPDVRCSIQAFEDAAGMKPVENGASLGYGGGAPKVWVRAIVENTGGRAAADFQTSVRVKNNGANLFAKTEALTLPSGLAKIYPLVQVHLGKSNSIQVSVSADSGNSVQESNEGNNNCTFTASATVVH